MQHKVIEVFATLKANGEQERVVATEEGVTVPGSLKEAIEDEGEAEVFRRYLQGPSRLTEERNRVRKELVAMAMPTKAHRGRRARAEFVQLVRSRGREGGVAISRTEERGDVRRRQRSASAGADDEARGGFGLRH